VLAKGFAGRLAAVLVLGTFCAGSASLCQADDLSISFVSDTTWTASAMNADGSLGAPLGPAQCACSDALWGCWQEYIQRITAAIPGLCEIWEPGVTGTSVSDLQGAYFVKQFDLPGEPTGGDILVTVDDFAEVSVNGSIVGSTGSISDISAALNAQQVLTLFDVTPYLVPGLNTISIRAQNGPDSFSGYGCHPCDYSRNPAGLAFEGTLSFDSPVPARLRTWGRLKTTYR
jgi:hypothetical protein